MNPDFDDGLIHQNRLWGRKDSETLLINNGAFMKHYGVSDAELHKLIIEEFEAEHDVDLPD